MMRHILAVAATAILLAGCGLKDNLVVILPPADGHVGGVVVKDDSGATTVLDKPYAAAEAGRGSARVDAVAVDPQEIQQIFGKALATRPIPPKSFRLYFLEGRDVMTPDSNVAFEDVFKDIARRKAAEVMVVGHTDTVGKVPDNDALGLKRAQAIRGLLIQRGLPADSVGAAGRGERELLVQTGDDVPEPRNRRVEITVR